MSLHWPTQNQNRVRPLNPNSRTSVSFPHASSGNPGETGTGPPINTFGGDDFAKSQSFSSTAIFAGVPQRIQITFRLVVLGPVRDY
jgi:hypothetical protein